LDSSEFNSRGLLVIGAAVLVTVVLLAAVPKHGSLGGVKTGVVVVASGTTLPSATTLVPATTKAGSTATTKAPTGTTAKGSSATTAAPTTTINPSSRPVLRLGSTGADVTTLQQKLIALGLLTSTADGNFGSGTQAAVIKFQQSKNLSPADGVVGPATWAALG
jgi:peptidoglycan hydrolase-like protein with peptidoglycan-binding domain